MSLWQVSPKRKASQTIGSPSKRTSYDSDSGITICKCSPSKKNPSMRAKDRLMPDFAICLNSGYSSEGDTTCLDCNSSHPKDDRMSIGDEGPAMIPDNKDQMPTPPPSGNDVGDIGSAIQPYKTRALDADLLSNDFFPLDIPSEDDTEEFGYRLPSKEYVELHVLVRVTRLNAWAKVIEISCTYAGKEVAYASGHLICRDLIRDNFFESMDSLGKPASNRIDELLDHHGYFRWSIKEHYLREKTADWNNSLETGSILQVDEVLVSQEWQSQALGTLMVTSLIDRAEKRDCCAQFAYVLPSTGCFWEADEPGSDTYDQSRSSVEQHLVRIFLGVGFTRAAETGWLVLDIAEVDEDPSVVPQKGESMFPRHIARMTGLQ